LLLVQESTIDIVVDIIGTHACVNIQCLLLGTKNTSTNLRITTNHLVWYSESSTTIGAIAEDNASLWLEWTVYIAPNTPKSSGHLTQQTLIVGSNTRIRNKPVLDIRHNDVRASHAAKIERLEWEKLFYMKSKWLEETQAQSLLIWSYILTFLGDTQEKERNELQKTITQALSTEISL